MFEVKTASFGNGTVLYLKKVEGRAAETKTSVENNVTLNVHNAELREIPAHYEVSFQIAAKSDHDGIEVTNFFTVTTLVAEPSDQASYRGVEDRAARELAPILRAIADRIEAGLPSFG